MALSVKKFLIGVSAVAGFSAIASTPVQALSITFDGSGKYRTYTHDTPLYKYDANSAISALTDGNIKTNVELWYENENPTANVGFTATEGTYTVKVTSLTAGDFSTFQDKWLADLLKTYAPLNNVWSTLNTNAKTVAINLLTNLGTDQSDRGLRDPNIGEFYLDNTGAINIQMLGFLDLKPQALATIGAYKANPFFSAYTAELNQLANAINSLDKLQISEIAKVQINNQIEYAYSFSATPSGFVAKDDNQSYSGVYTWSKQGTPASVPEPSALLGLVGIAGFVAAKRKQLKKA